MQLITASLTIFVISQNTTATVKAEDKIRKYAKKEWTAEEDERLKQAVMLVRGKINWREISESIPNRDFEQCKRRYQNHLAKGIKPEGFTQEEDALLTELAESYIKQYGIGCKIIWRDFVQHFEGRTKEVLKNRYHTIKNKIATNADNTSVDTWHIRSIWTKNDDEQLKRATQNLTLANKRTYWANIAKKIPGKNARQCRERYENHLDPEINRTKFTQDEDHKLMQLVREYGTKWKVFSKFFFKGRPAHMLKNRCYHHLKNDTAFCDLTTRTPFAWDADEQLILSD